MACLSPIYAEVALDSYNALDCDGRATFAAVIDDGEINDATVQSTQGFGYGNFGFDPSNNTFYFEDVQFTDYRGFGSFTVRLIVNGQSCEVSGKVAECCEDMPYDYLFIDEDVQLGGLTGTIIFFGDVNLYPNIVFDQAECYGGPDAKLRLYGFAEAFNSVFTRYCDYLWDGFYLPDASASLNFTESTAEEAIRAINVNQGGQLFAQSSTFQDNIISHFITDDPGVGVPYQGSNIAMDGNTYTLTHPAAQLTPHPSTPIPWMDYLNVDCNQSTTGKILPIYVINSEKVNIGHPQYGLNQFENPNGWGVDFSYVHLKNSQAQIRNNTLKNISNISICAQNSNLVIGEDVFNEPNTIHGPVYLNNCAAHIVENTFSFNGAVQADRPKDVAALPGLLNGVHIIDNIFNDAGSVRVKGFGTTGAVRMIGNTLYGGSAAFSKVGGGAASPQLNKRLIVNDNTFSDPYNESNNGIKISVFACKDAVVGNNSISTWPGHTPMAAGYMGIRVYLSTNSLITQNSITNCDRGIVVKDQCLGTQFTCNDLTDCYYGFYIDGAQMSDQATGGYASENQWQWSVNPPPPNSGRRVAGNLYSGSMVDWNWSSGTTYNPGTNLPSGITAYASKPIVNCTAAIPTSRVASNSSDSNDGNTSVLASASQDNLFVYPNPTRGNIIIRSKTELSTGSELWLFNTQGQLVKRQQSRTGENLIDISHLSNGIYLLKTGEASLRIVKY